MNDQPTSAIDIADRLPPDWGLPEKLPRLEITAPPNWNEYDAYLLDGGTLEYEEWTIAHKETPDREIEG